LKSDDLTPLLSGAGGYWQVIDEVYDPTIVQQQDRFACGPACGEMLLKEYGINHINQTLIANECMEVPVDVRDLVRVLNQLQPIGFPRWVGGFPEIQDVSDADVFDLLISTGVWAAELRQLGTRIGHLVIVDGWDTYGLILIRDPWQQTRYKIEKGEFLKHWTNAIWRKI
jgi:Papain-like cysteine protease AvrRpt2